jgi:hypothetical protein
MLYNGNVLFWYTTGTINQLHNSYVLSNVQSCTAQPCSLTDVSPTTFTDDILCAGMSAGTANNGLSNEVGTIIATGGMTGDNPPNGLARTSYFFPSSQQWQTGATMNEARFYPSNVQKTDGTTITLGGSNNSALVPQMESFNGTSWTNFGPQIPQSTNLYPRVKLVPESGETNGQYVMAGEGVNTYVYDPPSSSWVNTASMTFGNNRDDGGVVILPGPAGLSGLSQIFTAGGNTAGDGSGCPTNTSETYTISGDVGSWGGATSQCMCYARYNHNLVLLADGTVLAVGGGNGFGKNYQGPIFRAELYTPGSNGASGTWQVLAAQTANRTYHSTALLLPDGRVISAGSDTVNNGNLQDTFEIFSPPYLFNSSGGAAIRPSITSVSSSSPGYNNANFTIGTDTSNIKTVGLVRPGTATHANDFEERYVSLAFTQVGNTLTVTTPHDASYAPPGHYMLFVVSSSGVPSVSAVCNPVCAVPSAFITLQ